MKNNRTPYNFCHELAINFFYVFLMNILINKYDRTIVDQELRDPVSILCKSLNVQNLRDFDLINK